MLLIPTTMLVLGSPDLPGKFERSPCTFDADKVSLYAPLENGTTRILFDNGSSALIEYDYDDLMKFLADQGDEGGTVIE